MATSWNNSIGNKLLDIKPSIGEYQSVVRNYQFKESTDSETFKKCHELLAYKEIVLCWIPSHIGIKGNEMVDNQAKTSLSLEPTSFKISFSNLKPSINKYILEEWPTSWNNSI